MRRLLPYAVAAVLVLAVKGFLVLSLADVFFYGEELAKGTVAKALVDDVPIERYRLAYHYYEGGGFAISHATAVLFALVGPNLLAHKLVSLCVNLLVAAAGVTLARASFGRTAALAFAVLYTLAPLGFQKLSLLNLGIHYETSLFLLLGFHFALKLALEERAEARTAFLLGAVLGFGTFFNYQMLPAAAFLLAGVLIERRRALLGPGFVYLAAGALVGALPLVYMVSTVGSAVFDIHGTPLFGGEGQAEGTDRWSKMGDFAGWIVEGRGVVGWTVLLAQLLVPVAAGVLLSLARERRRSRAARALLLYLVFFAAVYVSSPFVVGTGHVNHFRMQRLTPFWILGTVLAAGWIGVLAESPARARRLAGWGLLAFFAVAGADATRRAAAEGRPGEPGANLELLRRTRGYAYPEYFAKLVGHLHGGDERKLYLLMSFREPDVELLYPAVAETLYRRSAEPTAEILTRFAVVSPDHWPALVHGLGPYLLKLDSERLRVAVARASGLSDELRPHVFEALGRSHHYFSQPRQMSQDLARLRGLEVPFDYFRGFGYRVYRMYRLDHEGALEFVETAPEEHREALRRGYETAREIMLLGPDTHAAGGGA